MNAKTCRPGLAISFVAFALVLAVALPTLAYKYPLSTSDIRNAYLLGTRKDSVTADFFAKYRHDLPAPRSGPYVTSITVVTPYAQVVDRGQSEVNSDSQQAEVDLAHNEFSFIVRVLISVTPTYPPQPRNYVGPQITVPDFEGDFKIQMSQDGKKIESRSQKLDLLSDSDSGGVTGAIFELRYKIGDIDPSGEVTVKVRTPDDQDVETVFSLGGLQ